MSNSLALVLLALVLGVFAADILVFDWDLHIFLWRKLVDLVHYLAFWR